MLFSSWLGAAAPSARIAFLDKGDVWLVSPDNGGPQRITRTGGRVEDFRFSPRGDYLAYSKRIRAADERPICSIVIIAAATNAVIKEIRPDSGWIDIDKWLGRTLLYHASSGMEVSGVFEFDPVRRTGREVEAGAGSIALDSDMTPDGSLLAYVDDIGVGPTFEERLHLLDTATGADSIHVSKRSVMAPAIAPTKDSVAFLEVVDAPSGSRDRVWVYRRSDRSLTMLDDGAVRAKSGGSGLAWSSDGRYLSINYEGRVTVLDTGGGAAPRMFRGVDACWSGANSVVIGNRPGLDALDVATGVPRRVVARGTRPQCLDAR